jgi:hypothetical protein
MNQAAGGKEADGGVTRWRRVSPALAGRVVEVVRLGGEAAANAARVWTAPRRST